MCIRVSYVYTHTVECMCVCHAYGWYVYMCPLTEFFGKCAYLCVCVCVCVYVSEGLWVCTRVSVCVLTQFFGGTRVPFSSTCPGCVCVCVHAVYVCVRVGVCVDVYSPSCSAVPGSRSPAPVPGATRSSRCTGPHADGSERTTDVPHWSDSVRRPAQRVNLCRTNE